MAIKDGFTWSPLWAWVMVVLSLVLLAAGLYFILGDSPGGQTIGIVALAFAGLGGVFSAILVIRSRHYKPGSFWEESKG